MTPIWIRNLHQRDLARYRSGFALVSRFWRVFVGSFEVDVCQDRREAMDQARNQRRSLRNARVVVKRITRWRKLSS